ncbi:aminotransferase class I and II [Pycnococcus provasolii]|uniref:Aminotransferase class I and II n=1 Tax=Pycnococcus provasolii TaxID=41880 RepID=A0A830H8Y2_9CHLO|nr:aminotransferase class I and II [Pycnococcus provasolii]
MSRPENASGVRLRANSFDGVSVARPRFTDFTGALAPTPAPSSSIAASALFSSAGGPPGGNEAEYNVIDEKSPYARLRAPINVLAATNPIRAITDALPTPTNEMYAHKTISLAVGDPTAAGLTPPEKLTRALRDTERHGYPPSVGHTDCRAAVAAHINANTEDVMLTAGCSQALEHAIRSLASQGSSVLIPSPGFPLYETLCKLHGVQAKRYPLHALQNFMPDLNAWRRLVDDTTVAVVVCNPGNPTGHVSTRTELTQMANAAAELGLVVLADEVYSSLAFARPFVPMASVSERAPVLSLGAISKNLYAPGWRLGWIAVHDRAGILEMSGVRRALLNLCQVSLGPCSLVQGAVARYFTDAQVAGSEAQRCAESHIADACSTLAKRAAAASRHATEAGTAGGGAPLFEPPAPPAGAMYLWLRLAPGTCRSLKIGKDDDAVDDEVAFVSEVLRECAVVMLPGSCFSAPGHVRISTVASEDALSEAFHRIELWCASLRGDAPMDAA